jgi:hypothetical protein
LPVSGRDPLLRRGSPHRQKTGEPEAPSGYNYCFPHRLSGSRERQKRPPCTRVGNAWSLAPAESFGLDRALAGEPSQAR